MLERGKNERGVIEKVDDMGIEPTTSALRTLRSPNCVASGRMTKIT